MDDFRAKLIRLKEQRKEASQSNFREVLEESEQAKRPPNWEKKLERSIKKLEAEDEASAAGAPTRPDNEAKKSLQIQADQLEKWDKIRNSKRQKQDPGFVDYETSTKRQYSRLTKQLKPNQEEYQALRQQVGDETFYLKNKDQVPKSSLIIDSKEGQERMVEDLNKQIEVRSKRSRRRRFDDDADVDYINERNMRFNKKLERSYKEYTEEIKQNLERGTAL